MNVYTVSGTLDSYSLSCLIPHCESYLSSSSDTNVLHGWPGTLFSLNIETHLQQMNLMKLNWMKQKELNWNYRFNNILIRRLEVHSMQVDFVESNKKTQRNGSELCGILDSTHAGIDCSHFLCYVNCALQIRNTHVSVKTIPAKNYLIPHT